MATYKQIYQLVNKVNADAWGKNAVPTVTDLSGLISTGNMVFDSSQNTDIWTGKLMDQIRGQLIANRVRSQKFLSNIYKTTEEFGAYLQKIIVKVSDARPESQWTLNDGDVLNNPTAVFPDVQVNLFESHDVYRFEVTIPIDQLNAAFLSEANFAAFIAAISTEMENKINATEANLARMCVDNFIAEKYDYQKTNPTKGVHAINTLALYNAAHVGNEITLAESWTNPDFIRFECAIIKKYLKRMADDTTVFNINGLNRQTTKEHLNFIMHSEAVANADTYLRSDVFHNDLVGLGDAFQEINFWQASGSQYDTTDTAKINVTTSDGNDVEIPCVIGFAFDVDALGVCWEYRKARNFYSAEYDVNHRIESLGVGFFNDYNNENGVVFYREEAEAETPGEGE